MNKSDTIWDQKKFEDIYLEPSRNGLSKPSRLRGTGIKMVNMKEIFAYSRISNPEMELVPMDTKELENYLLKKGDLLFARQSLVASGAGKCSIVLTTPEKTTFESHLIRVRIDPSKANPFFYYYYFISPKGIAKTQSLVMQVAAAGIRASELARLDVDYPSKKTQDKIVTLLEKYDDLIDNNNRRIQLLESMAKLIYNEWFVKFKFPDYKKVKMIDSGTELGDIPNGWEIKSAYDVAAITFGHPFKSNKFCNDDSLKPIVRIRDIISNSTSTYSNEEVDEKYEIHLGDMLIGMDGIFHICKWSNKTAYLNQRVARLRPINDVSKYFLYLSIKPRIERLNDVIVGTTVQHLSQRDFQKMMILVPPKNLMDSFRQVADSIYENGVKLKQKNQNLITTRNLLLPRLMSGEIDVSKLDIKILEVEA